MLPRAFTFARSILTKISHEGGSPMRLVVVLWAIFLAQVVKEWLIGDSVWIQIGLTVLFVLAAVATFLFWYSINLVIPKEAQQLGPITLCILLIVGVIIVVIGSFLANDRTMVVVGGALVAIPLIELAPEIMGWPEKKEK